MSAVFELRGTIEQIRMRYMMADATLLGRGKRAAEDVRAGRDSSWLGWAAEAVLCGVDLASLVNVAWSAALYEQEQRAGQYRDFICEYCGHEFAGELRDNAWRGRAYGAECPRCHWINGSDRAPADYALRMEEGRERMRQGVPEFITIYDSDDYGTDYNVAGAEVAPHECVSIAGEAQR